MSARRAARSTRQAPVTGADAPSPRPGFPGARAWLLYLALAAAALAAYSPALAGEALWDDDGHLTQAELRSIDGLRRIWFEPGATQQYYPLVHSAFWLMDQAWGGWTPGYHVVNVLLHALSAFLIAVLMRRLALPGGVFAAFVFALHPVQAESVAWITELKNTLSTPLYLGAALTWLSFDETRDRRWWMLSFALFAAALASKTVTATLPAGLLIVQWWRRGRVTWADVRPLIPFFALGAAAGFMTAWVEHHFIGARGSDFDLTIVERGLLAGRAVWFYAWKLAAPAGLVFIYPRWTVDQAVWWQYLFPLALLAAVFVLWRMRVRARGPLAAVLLYVAALGPALGFVNVFPFRYSFVADHFQYLASIAMIAAGAAVLARVVPRFVVSVQARYVLAGAVVATLGVLTWIESHQYASAETLYRTTIARNPGAWMAHHNLGEILLRGSGAQSEEGLALVRESLRLKPDHPEALNTMGYVLQRQGRLDEARRYYEEARRLSPGMASPHNNLGVVAALQGRFEEAVGHYREAIRLNPRDSEAMRNLGLALIDLGRVSEAREVVERAASLAPNDPRVESSLGTLAVAEGRLDEAMARFERAKALAPDDADVLVSQGLVLERLERPADAAARYRDAIARQPASARAHDALGYLLLRQGRFSDAALYLQEAVRLRPGYGPSHLSLAMALDGAGRMEAAIATFEHAFTFPEIAASADAHNAFGVTLAQSGRLPAAIAEFEKALQLQPGHPDAARNLARARGR